MAVRPWENHFLNINLRDGVMIHEDGPAEGKNGANSQIKPTIKKPAASSLNANLSSQKTGPSHSDASDSPPGKSVSVLEAVNALSSKPKSKTNIEDLGEEAGSRPIISSRSHSNPKERSIQSDNRQRSDCLCLTVVSSLSSSPKVYRYFHLGVSPSPGECSGLKIGSC